MKRLLIGLFILIGIFSRGIAFAETPAAIFVVNDAGDASDSVINGTCATAGNVCTLRAAIQEANATVAQDTIRFSTGASTIMVTSALPPIARPIIIDGQACPSGLDWAGSGTASISYNGASAGVDGLTLAAGSNGSTIKGIVIRGFSGDGIQVDSDNNTIQCSYIGVWRATSPSNPNDQMGIRVTGDNNLIGGNIETQRNSIDDNAMAGVGLFNGTGNQVFGNYIGIQRFNDNIGATTSFGNDGNGVYIEGGSANLVGNGAFSRRNIIADNGVNGIRINGGSGHIINLNYIGLDVLGETALGNSAGGIEVDDGSNITIRNNYISGNSSDGILLWQTTTNTIIEDNIIGRNVNGNALGNSEYGISISGSGVQGLHIESNTIADNGADGILINDGSINNEITKNSIQGNVGRGIELGKDGVDENDKGDPDGGDNLKHNYPIITEASNIGHIEGVLDSSAGTHRVEFFQNDDCDNASNNGEGQTYLGAVNVTTPGDGTLVPFSVDFLPFAAGYVTATATDSNGNTSEFSLCAEIQIEPIPLVVNSDGDAGDSDVGDAICQTSSRAPECTLRAALEQANGFATPVHITFSDERFILPNSPLPVITTPVEIDGLTQGSCSSAAAAAHGLNVTLDGINAGGAANGLHFAAGSEGSTVKGIVIGRFQQNGIVLESNNNDIYCNHIGEDGSGSFGNAGYGVYVSNANNNDIGNSGSNRNVISGNGAYGVRVDSGVSNRVRGNYIGTSLNGAAASANSDGGIYLLSSPATTIGGSDTLRNVISGNGGYGIQLALNSDPANKVQVLGNTIGRNQAKTVALPNNDYGIYLFGNNEFDIRDNTISSNNGEGIYIADVSADLYPVQNTIENNIIGHDQTGASFGNQGGIYVGALTPVTISDNVIGANHTNPAVKVSCDVAVETMCADDLANGNVGVIIEDNFIGVQSDGTTLITASPTAVHLQNAEGVIIQRNVIAASSATVDLLIESDGAGNESIGNLVSDNQVGISADGNTDLNSGTNAIVIGTDTLSTTLNANQIGADGGVALTMSGDSSTISNNSIGTNATGTLNAGGSIGIHVDGGDDNTFDGNIVGYNSIGVQIDGANGNNFYGNGVGTDTAGTLDIGNSSHGVHILNGSMNNGFGGDAGLAYNQVRNNGGVGIVVSDISVGNALFANEINANGLLGIDLNDDDVTLNDDAVCDSDTGPNDKQNFPTLTGVSVGGNILGTLKSRPSRNYRVDVFTSASCDDLFNHGEGSQFFGSTNIQMGVSGSFDFSVPQANAATPLGFYTAIATNLLTGDTSEFSACFTDGVPTAVGFSQQEAISGGWWTVNSGQVWVVVGLVGMTLFAFWQGRRGIVLLVIGLVLVGAAFAPVETYAEEERVPNSCGAFDDLLEDGSSAQSGSGVVVGAVAGTLNEDVRISALVAPVPSPAYDQFGTVVGDYFQISAETHKNAPPDKPFLIGVPVPNGVDTNHLAIAMLLDPTSVKDEAATELSWYHTQGYYDSSNNLLTFTSNQLTNSNFVFTIVEDPLFDMLPAPNSREAQASPDAVNFNVSCFAAGCTQGVKDAFAAELVAAYNDFVVGHGFNEPHLKKQIPSFGSGAQPAPNLTNTSTFRGVIISDPSISACDGINGVYVARSQTLRICSITLPIMSEWRGTIRHELFHAIQTAYPTMVDDPADDFASWVWEGTASVAGASIGATHRSSKWNRRIVTEPLQQTYHDTNNGRLEYEGQDFWYYMLDEYSQPLGYLEQIFTVGAEATDVNAAINNSLPPLYFEWVRNQVYEHHNLLDGAFSGGDACSLVRSLVPFSPNITSIIHTDFDYHVDVFLEPLTSTWVEFDVVTILSGAQANVTASVNGGDAPFYRTYWSDDPDCLAIPDGERSFGSLHNSDSFGVLISNTSFDSAELFGVDVTISIDG